MKKVLFVATVAKTHICVFHLPYLKMFQNKGYKTYVAARNDFGAETCKLEGCDVYYDIPFERNPFHPGNIKAYKQLKKLIDTEKFDIIHCHTPVGGVLTRIAAYNARKKGTKVIYTAHGFHFFKGAPLINWLLYYPIEKLCAYFTDALITINHEDYELAKMKMKADHVYYIPGVGIDVNKFVNTYVDIDIKRAELGIPKNAIVLLSVGELNKNKNHKVIIEALSKIKNPNIHYCIAGKGPLEDYLSNLAEKFGLSDYVHLLGFRNDVSEIYKIADIFCFPSLREGLGLAAIEAMSSKLPLITSNIHGINDYSINGITGYKCFPKDIKGFACSIELLCNDPYLRDAMGQYNCNISKQYDLLNTLSAMEKIYTEKVLEEKEYVPTI